MKKISPDLIEKYFLTYSQGSVKRSNGILNGKCPTCKEGKSWNKGKKRLYYIPEKDLVCCHNCNLSMSGTRWVSTITNIPIKTLLEENKFYNNYIDIAEEPAKDKSKHMFDLPFESINLSNPQQLQYYKDNYIVKEALDYITTRRLSTAANNCNFYISLKDFIHKNRLVLPFYNLSNKIIHYQTRAIFKKDEEFGKYLSKKDSDKSIFGIQNIKSDYPFIFITEGPIDSMFISKNGISMAGLSINDVQKQQLRPFMLHEKIWVLDNQLDNEEVKDKYNELIDKNERVFIWPKKFVNIKDINELCCKLNINSIKSDFIIENSFVGHQAKLKINI